MALPPPGATSTCLVTGASSGIGADIARELAARGHGVTLVARREDRLRELAGEIEGAHGVRAETVGCDLSDPAARERLIAQVEERGLTVEVLVNNAGFGSGGLFHELDLEVETRMVRVNVDAVVVLCGTYVPEMVHRGRGAVLNVASTTAFQPLPRQATYAASKAFVLSFTEALRADLHGTGVTVTALCPGPVRTEFVQVGGFERAAEGAPEFLWTSPAETARAAVIGLERGRRLVVPGKANRLGTLAGQHAPRGALLALARRFYPVGR